jgi:hypothetical protein
MAASTAASSRESPAEVLAQLDRILASEMFSGAGRLRRLLRYIVSAHAAKKPASSRSS